MPIDPRTFDRLVKLLEMTSSDQDGEALNALRMAQRIMKEQKVTWKDLLGLTGIPRPSVQAQAPAPAPTPTPTWSANPYAGMGGLGGMGGFGQQHAYNQAHFAQQSAQNPFYRRMHEEKIKEEQSASPEVKVDDKHQKKRKIFNF